MKKKAKTKKYADGGLAGIADSAQSLMGDVDNLSSVIKFGTGGGKPAPLGFNAVTQSPARSQTGYGKPAFSGFPSSINSTTTADMTGAAGRPQADSREAFKNLSNMLSGQQAFKKGGSVKSIDGCAIRGKTRAKLKGK